GEIGRWMAHRERGEGADAGVAAGRMLPRCLRVKSDVLLPGSGLRERQIMRGGVSRPLSPPNHADLIAAGGAREVEKRRREAGPQRAGAVALEVGRAVPRRGKERAKPRRRCRGERTAEKE